MTVAEQHDLPWLNTEVECQECGMHWVAMCQLGAALECPECGSKQIDTDAIEGES